MPTMTNSPDSPDHSDAPDPVDTSESELASKASEIPLERLPEGFADRVRSPGTPASPRPAATIILMRPTSGSEQSLEVLLLRRVRSAGFVPGAWVFPGGRVDTGDSAPGLLERLGRSDGSEKASPNPSSHPPEALVAAIREAFEETGILLARDAQGVRAPSAGEDSQMDALRTRLLDGAMSFGEILEHGPWWMDPGAVGYIAHWITPKAEPRRYDTRFFAGAVPEGTSERIHEAEASHSVWLSPVEALKRHSEGELPMIFPTIKTLEALRPFDHPDQVLEHHRDLEIPTILPRLVRTPTGVGIRMPDEEEG
ncbi:MAG: NUDIX hydrolase [Gemmatimonadales bacterium]|nr:MAG: NUDIX hydrolase [Gemmatimonadales bacterium]